MLGALECLGNNRNALYDGYLGDVLAAYHWVNCGGELLASWKGGGVSSVVSAICNRFFPSNPWVDDCIAASLGHDTQLSAEAAREHIELFFKRFTHLHNPITHFFIFSRGCREIAAASWGMYFFVDRVFAPFADRELFMFLISQEERVEAAYAEQRSRAISKAYPRLADIPYATPKRATLGQLFIRRLKAAAGLLAADLQRAGLDQRQMTRWLTGHIKGSAQHAKLARFCVANQFLCLSQHRASAALEWATGCLQPYIGDGEDAEAASESTSERTKGAWAAR